MDQAVKRSRKVIIDLFVDISVELARKGLPKLGTLIKALGLAVFNSFLTILDTSVGKIIAKLLDSLDGKKDGYIYA